MAIVLDLSLDPVIARIESQVSAFRKVGGAADLATAARELKQEPAAFVIPVAESARPNTAESLIVSQLVAQRFGVVIAVQNLADSAGKAAQTELGPLRLALFNALVGWVPPLPVGMPAQAERELVTFGGGRLLRLEDRVLWWQDNFDTAYYLRTTS